MFTRLKAALFRRLGRTDPFAYVVDVYDAFSRYHRQYGRWPNVLAPQSFHEWIQRRKLFDRRPEFAVFADKLAVRDYIAERVGAQHLTTVYAVYDHQDQFCLADLPQQFAMKLTANWHKHVFVSAHEDVNEAELRGLIGRWLRQNYYDVSREAAYRDIKQRVFCEELLVNEHGSLSWDYKIHCFAGRPLYVEVISDRSSGRPEKGWYTSEWQPIDAQLPGQAMHACAAPTQLASMLDIAAALSRGFDYLRVDPYQHRGRVLVGEITFHPGNGFAQMTSASFSRELGRRWAAARAQLRTAN